MGDAHIGRVALVEDFVEDELPPVGAAQRVGGGRAAHLIIAMATRLVVHDAGAGSIEDFQLIDAARERYALHLHLAGPEFQQDILMPLAEMLAVVIRQIVAAHLQAAQVFLAGKMSLTALHFLLKQADKSLF